MIRSNSKSSKLSKDNFPEVKIYEWKIPTGEKKTQAEPGDAIAYLNEKPLWKWTNEELSKWIEVKLHSKSLGAYFKRQKFTGKTMQMEMNHARMQMLGIPLR